MANFVDGVAMVMPWAGGLVPATMTYNNLVITGVDPWQAFVVAAVVEGLGFVTVTTVIDFYEHGRTSPPSPLSWESIQERGRKSLDGMFWIALGGAALYLAAVVVINTFLDTSATLAKMVTGAILSTFGVLGGVMVALRNQLGKRRAAQEQAEGQERAERARVQALQLAREKDLQEYERQVARERMLADERERTAERELRLAEKRLKLELRVAESRKEPAQVAERVAESSNGVAESHGKWQRWSQLPADERARVAEICNQSQAVFGENWKKSAVLRVMEEYSLKERVGYEWLKYATRTAEVAG